MSPSGGGGRGENSRRRSGLWGARFAIRKKKKQFHEVVCFQKLKQVPHLPLRMPVVTVRVPLPTVGGRVKGERGGGRRRGEGIRREAESW